MSHRRKRRSAESRLLLDLVALRRSNSYLLTGVLASSPNSLDRLIQEHLQTEQMLRGFDAYEELIVRMTAEGYSAREMAAELGCTTSTVNRLRAQLRLTLALAIQ